MDTLEKAALLFSTLVENGGKIERNKETNELFQYYYNPEIKESLNVLIDSFKLGIFAGDNSLYLFPKNDSIFAYNTSDVKKAIRGANTNPQVYLAYIILLVFIVEIYGGENDFNKTRNFISENMLVEKIDKTFKTVEAEDVLDDDVGLNFHAASLCWKSLLSNDNKTSSTSKVGFVHSSMMFFEDKASLIFRNDDTGETHYYPTQKLEDFVKSGNFDMERFEEVKETVADKEN